MGSCVDNSRILVLAAELGNALNVLIHKLPIAGAAHEWYSQKAVSIGAYFVASGVYTVLGVMPHISGSSPMTRKHCSRMPTPDSTLPCKPITG